MVTRKEQLLKKERDLSTRIETLEGERRVVRFQLRVLAKRERHARIEAAGTLVERAGLLGMEEGQLEKALARLAEDLGIF